MSDDRISVDHPARMADGIYFGLPDDAYHAAFALSSHGIKNLRRSTLDFWVRSALNPDAFKLDEDTEAMKIGRAYDARIVEGREVFEQRFAPALDQNDYPNALRTNADLKDAIIERGGGIRRGRERKEELIQTLAQLDPTALMWDTLVRGHQAAHAGKTLLPRAVMDRIEIAAKMIEAHPQLCKAFTGGEPQVSIFWTDEETGVPCKARLDYLKPRAIVDLKSIGNEIGLPIEKACYRAVANYRYHIQAAFYLEAAAQCRDLIIRNRIGGTVSREFLSALAAGHDKTVLMVFQQKGPAPVARGMVMPTGLTLDLARMEISEAKYRFARCWQTFGTDPWVDIEDIGTFDSTGFPAYIAE